MNSEILSKSLRELILDLLSKEYLEIKIFITITQNWKGNFNLIYKNKFYNKASTIATYPLAYLLDTYNEPILSISLIEYKDQARLYI